METLTVLAISEGSGLGDVLARLPASGAVARFRVLTATDMDNARDLLGSVRIDVLLAHLACPEAEALAFLRALRAAAPRLPLVAVAADEGIGLQALGEGAQESLSFDELTGPLLARTLRHACERVRARASLLLSEEKFRTMADFTADWEYWVGPDRRLIYISPSCERFSGYRAEEYIADPGLIERIVYPEDRECFVRHQVTVFGGLGAAPPQEEEFRIVTRSGEVRWIGHLCQNVVGHDGRALGRRVSNRDITARKLAEERLRALNAELERRVVERTADLENTNRELESFAYSVSHDLRAPLRTIEGFSRMLLEERDAGLDGAAVSRLERVHEASGRMSALIEDLLRLSRVMRLQLSPIPVDLSGLAAAVIEDLRREQPEREVEAVIRPGLSAVGDRNMLGIALRNLLENAWKYTARVERPHIGFDLREVEGRRWFCVQDNGAGFDMAQADRLFAPFQRLHSVEEFPGTGIGLATVARIVHRHHGEIRAEGRPGAGASFFFTLGTFDGRDEGAAP